MDAHLGILYYISDFIAKTIPSELRTIAEKIDSLPDISELSTKLDSIIEKLDSLDIDTISTRLDTVDEKLDIIKYVVSNNVIGHLLCNQNDKELYGDLTFDVKTVDENWTITGIYIITDKGSKINIPTGSGTVSFENNILTIQLREDILNSTLCQVVFRNTAQTRTINTDIDIRCSRGTTYKINDTKDDSIDIPLQ